MANEKKISVHTQIGEVTACVGGGVQIVLVVADVDVETKYARALLYGDTATDDWTKQHTWSEDEINVCDE